MKYKDSVAALHKVKVRFHYTWIAIFIFMTAAVITQFSTGYPFLQRLMLGIVSSAIFLLTLIIRTLIITWLAIRRGAVVRSQTIFAIGTVLELDPATTFPSLELLIAISGILINLFVTAILFTIYQVLAQTGSIMIYVFVQWLAFICFMQSIFNILPGLPLDGGRVINTIIWKANGNFNKASLIMSWAGWALGMLFIVIGVVLTTTSRQWFVGFLLFLPGLILQNAATHQRRQIQSNTSGDTIATATP
jgi:Zn-dependent protease